MPRISHVASIFVAMARSALGAAVTFVGSSWDGPVGKYRPDTICAVQGRNGARSILAIAHPPAAHEAAPPSPTTSDRVQDLANVFLQKRARPALA
jgi:hypothetical protein